MPDPIGVSCAHIPNGWGGLKPCTPTFCPELTHHAVSYVVPMVVEQTSRGERSYDIFSLLLKTASLRGHPHR